MALHTLDNITKLKPQYVRKYKDTSYTLKFYEDKQEKVVGAYIGGGHFNLTELAKCKSLKEAKHWLFVNHSVPMTGWKQAGVEYLTYNHHWRLIRRIEAAGMKKFYWEVFWIERDTWCEKDFKTRQGALEWINQYEKERLG